MSRLCVVGIGQPAFRPGRCHAGPGLRLTHFLTALARERHDVLALLVGSDDARINDRPLRRTAEIEGASVVTLDIREDQLADPGVRTTIEEFAPDALVGVSALGAGLACRLRLEVPLWADIFGDLMAEAQAKALVHGNNLSLVHFWTVLAPVLVRADRFSAVSGAQADALIGQLGMTGRLTAENAGERLVRVIPCAAEAEDETGGETGDGAGPVADDLPQDAFVVLWSGSFNTWCDVETLAGGAELAMVRDPSIHFVVTGGAVPGHDERTYEKFSSLVRASPASSRFHLRGWCDAEEAARWCRRADIGVVVERDLYERRLGSENRVVHWMAHGLGCITTARSELGRCLVARELALGCRPSDPRSLADAILTLANDRARAERIGRGCRAYAARHFGFSTTAVPLLDWARSPVHAADHAAPRPLSVGLLSEPRAMVHLLEGYLDGLRLDQVAYRSARWLLRRLRRSARGDG